MIRKLNLLGITILMLIPTLVFGQDKISKSIKMSRVGTITSIIPIQEAHSITDLKITGTMNATDFNMIKEHFTKLETLDLSDVFIRNYLGKNGTAGTRVQLYQNHAIPAYAFSTFTDYTAEGSKSLKKVILPKEVKSIGKNAFANCPNLEIVVVHSDTAPLLSTNALAPQQTAIFVKPGMRDIFQHSKDWESFAIIDNEPVTVNLKLAANNSLDFELIKCGKQAKSINYLTISGTLKQTDMKLIRDYMPNLIKVDLQDTDLIELPEYTFAQKVNLIEIKLPKHLNIIGQRAFENCNKLGPILNLPKSVNSIEDGAFSDCKNLNTVVASKALTEMGENIFGYDSGNRFLFKN